MANEHNLIPIRSESEAREKGRKGGKASGESRRRRRALRDSMELLLTCTPNEQVADKMRRVGLDEEDINMATAINMALVEQAMQGDVKAYREIRDLVGEAESKADDDPIYQMEIEDLDDLEKDIYGNDQNS